jgi:hypothetical protein
MAWREGVLAGLPSLHTAAQSGDVGAVQADDMREMMLLMRSWMKAHKVEVKRVSRPQRIDKYIPRQSQKPPPLPRPPNVPDDHPLVVSGVYA